MEHTYITFTQYPKEEYTKAQQVIDLIIGSMALVFFFGVLLALFVIVGA